MSPDRRKELLSQAYRALRLVTGVTIRPDPEEGAAGRTLRPPPLPPGLRRRGVLLLPALLRYVIATGLTVLAGDEPGWAHEWTLLLAD